MARSRNYIATPPGATIREQLKDRGMCQKEFAARLDISEKHVSKLMNGDVQLTPEMSVKLEIVLGVPARFWNNLEAIYREKLIKVQAENTMEEDEKLAKNMPYNEMMKYEWVPKTGNLKEKVMHLRKYFEIVELGLLLNSQITKIACKGLSVEDKNDLAFISWVQKARIEARNKNVKEFNMKKLNESVKCLVNDKLCKKEFDLKKVENLLAESGISVVFLPSLKDLKLEGATFVDGKRVVIALTEDKLGTEELAISLFHELAHIVLGHINNEGTSDKDEQDADRWAETMLGIKQG